MNSNEWKEIKLGEVATKITKGTTPTTLGEKFVESGVNYIKAEALTFDGTIDRSKFVWITLETHEKLRRSQLEEGDILFSMAGMVLGKTAVVRKEHLPANTNQALALIRLDKSLAFPKYIDYFMRQKTFFDYVNSSTGQSAQPNINLQEIGDLKINLPPIETQKRIASILSSLDDKIELNRQTNQTLEAIAHALFKEWFVDFNFPGATGEMVESELGMIPKGWRVGTIGDLFEISKASINPSLSPRQKFFHYSLPSFDEGKRASLEFGSSILSNKFIVKDNSILVSKLNPRIPRIWPVIEAETNSICSTEFQVLLPRVVTNFSYGATLFWQSNIIEIMKGRASGTSSSHQRIRPQDMLDIEIVVPDFHVSQHFDDKVKHFFINVKSNEDQNVTLVQLRDSLLPKLMKGNKHQINQVK